MKTDSDTSQGAGVSDSSVVWLRCEWKQWRMNTLAMLLPTTVVGIAAVEVPAVRFMAGILIGLWLGMVHNCLWAWLFRKERQPYAKGWPERGAAGERYEVRVQMGTPLWSRSAFDFCLGTYRWLWLAKLVAWWHVQNHPWRAAAVRCRNAKQMPVGDPTLAWVRTADNLPGKVGEQSDILMWSPEWATWLKGMVTRWEDGTCEWCLYDQQEDRYYVWEFPPEFWMYPTLPDVRPIDLNP